MHYTPDTLEECNSWLKSHEYRLQQAINDGCKLGERIEREEIAIIKRKIKRLSK